MKRKNASSSEYEIQVEIPSKKMKREGKKKGKENALPVATPQLELRENKLLEKGATDIEVEDNRAWETTGRAHTVRGGVIFGVLSVLHCGLTIYDHDIQAAPGYFFLGCLSFAMAMYAYFKAKTARSFYYALRMVLLLLSIWRIIAITAVVDCTSNTIGSTCIQLAQNKYPMRWAMDSICFLTLASSLGYATFATLAGFEIVYFILAMRIVDPSTAAEKGASAEFFFGLTVLILCTCNQLSAHERMREAIYYRERTDRIVNHRIHTRSPKSTSLRPITSNTRKTFTNSLRFLKS